ncbi:MAG TPA: motility-associated protein, partial [Polyangiaceae bacterium]|nr:motility-associated protein [Polyangiaceae bacterium]
MADKATLIGLGVGFGGIIVGNMIEGGRIAQILQPTAAMIVGLGTLGATMIQFPLATFIRAMKSVKTVMAEPPGKSGEVIEELVKYAAV